MLERLACHCEHCDRQLDNDRKTLTFERGGCVRHVYECSCGTVTITVARGQ